MVVSAGLGYHRLRVKACRVVRAVSARPLVLVRDISCEIECFGVSVGHVVSTASAKDVGETRRQ